MSLSTASCPFCETESEYFTGKNNFYEYRCSICGIFAISANALATVNSATDKYNLLNCVSENIKLNSKTGSPLNVWHLKNQHINADNNENIISKKLDYYLPLPIIHSDKPLNTLLYVAKLLDGKDPFKEIDFFKRDMLSLKIKDQDELHTWLNQLSMKKLINFTEPTTPETMYPGQSAGGFHNPIQARITITPDGWDKVFEKRQSLKSKKVFIAMQFNWEDINHTKNEFLNAVKEACFECGYDADVVPEHHTEPIMDKIIAAIKESHFVVADFTFNNRGAYFEAGYARALGIPVIHTVMDGHTEDKNDQRKHLHFDIQQINYIKWRTPSMLKQKLIERIKAAIK